MKILPNHEQHTPSSENRWMTTINNSNFENKTLHIFDLKIWNKRYLQLSTNINTSLMKVIRILAILINISLYAQDINPAWVKSVGGTLHVLNMDHTLDTEGNIYTVGYFSGTADFAPCLATNILTSNGYNDIYVEKWDSLGNHLWAHSFGSINEDLGYRVQSDSQNNLYVLGKFSDTVDFDPDTSTFELISSGSNGAFLLKLNSDGNFIWVKKIGGSFSSQSSDLFVSENDDIFITGKGSGTVDLNPNSGTFIVNGNGQFSYLMKLNSNGDFDFAKYIDNPSAWANIHNIATNAANEIIIAGQFHNNQDLNMGSGISTVLSSGYSDIFIQKLDSLGNFIWVKDVKPSSTARINVSNLVIDDNENIYLTGLFEDTVGFNYTDSTYQFASNGQEDFYVLKYNTNGDFKWATSTGGELYERNYDINVDSNGDLYVLGEFRDTVDFDPGPNVHEAICSVMEDFFIQKLDSMGQFIWVNTFPSTNFSYGSNIIIDDADNITISGTLVDTMDAFTGSDEYLISANGDWELLLMKLDQYQSSINTDVITACNSYTWTNGITYTESTITSFAIQNGSDFNCDSIVNLNLTIETLNDSVVSNDTTLFAVIDSAQFQWLDCSNNYAAIPNEENQFFTPTQSGNYAVEITQNGCIDTSGCYTISSIGLTDEFYTTEISVSPNPTSGILELNNLNDSGTQIKLYNLAGETILEIPNIKSKYHKLVFDAKPGIYILEVYSNSIRKNYKLIVQE